MKTGSSAPRVWLNPVAVWELLDRLDISQNQLARLAGISPGHLSLLMNGKRSPAPGVRRRLMKALGVDDFHVLFVMERPAAADWSAETTTTPKRKKGDTQGHSE
ncbi:MAG: helix-turn-helix transcriptional regulator [Chloroflexi bacterium]|nr:helix-turn-helix transcriptional regulator [Chloroflexota bacterium]